MNQGDMPKGIVRVQGEFVDSRANMEAGYLEMKCTRKKCDGMMRKGIAMGQTYTGMGDFRQSDAVCTVSLGGSGEVIPVLKCNKCGHSISIKEKGGD